MSAGLVISLPSVEPGDAAFVTVIVEQEGEYRLAKVTAQEYVDMHGGHVGSNGWPSHINDLDRALNIRGLCGEEDYDRFMSWLEGGGDE